MDEIQLHEDRAFHATQDVPTYSTWAEMGLRPALLGLIEQLGWSKPSPVQSRAIVPISMGRSILVQSQNGTGKTATFVIGALQRLPSSKSTELLVVSPTRELALQSESTLRSLGASVRSCIGGNSLGDDVRALRHSIHAISGTPGRVLQLIREHHIDSTAVRCVVLDEADEMLTSFKRTIYDILSLTRSAQLIVVTATVSEDVIELCTAFMPDGLRLVVPRDDLTISNVAQFVVRVASEEWKFDALRDLYQSVAIERAVIFVNTRDKGEWLADQMRASAFTVALAHGQLAMAEREKIAEEFRAGETRVIIATDVWARGIDVRNITLVINFDIPTQCETYLHRIGRSGRFGRKGIAITFSAGESDEKKLRKLQKFYSSTIAPLPSDLDSLFF
jgi:ATP-dependent RNA helicase